MFSPTMYIRNDRQWQTNQTDALWDTESTVPYPKAWWTVRDRVGHADGSVGEESTERQSRRHVSVPGTHLTKRPEPGTRAILVSRRRGNVSSSKKVI